MQGKIELHGAKQMLVCEMGTGTRQIESDKYIPGDIILLEKNGNTELVSRTPQSALGVTRKVENGISELYITNLGPTCKFITTINVESHVGDRFLLWLYEDGSIEVIERYTSSAKDDATSLLDLYKLEASRQIPFIVKGTPLYTRPDVVNHEDLDTFTIDPTTSVDFDDAITVDPSTNTVYIHIVDIATINHPQPENLWLRCFTLYLANEHTEHLLNEHDAAHTFSLIQGQSRPVITVKVELSADGNVHFYEIYKSTIVVKKRWDYTQVANALNDGTAPPAIVYLDNLSKHRSEKVNYNISLPSIRLTVNTESGEVDTLHSENTNDSAHSLVATAMILGNLVVSKHLRDSGINIPNRFHDSIRGFGPAADFAATGNPAVDSFIIVKRYARAFYSIDQRGHFGLGIKDYVHFTSPMRRYADVIVHNILAGHYYLNLEEEVEWLNRRAAKVKAIQALYTNWKVIRHLKTLDPPFEIWVTGVSPAGIMWFMPSLSLNGFIHVTALTPTQYWKLDGNKLIGTSTAHTFTCGTKLQAGVKNIDDVTSSVSLYLLQ